MMDQGFIFCRAAGPVRCYRLLVINGNQHDRTAQPGRSRSCSLPSLGEATTLDVSAHHHEELIMANKSWFPTWSERHREAEQFRGFKTQIDSLFEDWFGRSMGGVLAPRVDISEDAAAVTITAELPGVNEGDIEVSLIGDQLTLKGEKRSQHEQKGDMEGCTVHRMERSYGAFQRTLTIPYQIDPAQVSAQFHDGVLTVTVPKPPDALAQREGRKIEINKSDPSGRSPAV
jgi:HSP20 family protein